MVLNTANNIVSEQGIEALTVRKIALEIGYTVGTIYIVFANMQELIMHINAGTLDELTGELRAVVTDAGTEQHISQIADSYLKFASRNFNRWRIVFDQGLPGQPDYPEWYEQKVAQMFAPIETLFRQLSPHNSPEQAALAAKTLWCGVHGVCVLALQGNLGRAGVGNHENAVRLLVDNFVRGWKLSKIDADESV